MKKIVNGYLVDPAQKLEGYYDILIENSVVKGVFMPHESKNITADETLDAKGLYVFPGFIDLHVHLRTPGYPEKETIESGSRACAKGGFTTVACMPNTKPCLDDTLTISTLKKQISEESAMAIYPIGAITQAISSKKLTDHEALIKEGVIALSDDGKTTMNDAFMKEAFINSKKYGLPIITHCEDHSVTEQYINQPYPLEAESTIVARDVALCRETGGQLHIAHVSSPESLKVIEKAKKDGVTVTCEATPHHIALSDQIVDILDPMSKVNPPIRSEIERALLIEAIQKGVVDIIASDHAPHEMATKNGSYGEVTYGFSGIETSFQVGYTHLVKNNLISLPKLIEMMTIKPAQIAHLKNVGTLKTGYEANFVLVDLEATEKIDRDQFLSKGKNTPFHGMTLNGKVVKTFYKGNCIYDALS